MRKRTLGVVLVAGLAISGSSAFTGSNTMPTGSDARKAGYGAVKASGVTVSKADYTFTANNSGMDKIVFTTTGTDLTGLTSTLTLTASSAPDTVVAEMDCTNAAVLLTSLAGDWTVTCDLSPDIALTTFDTVGLTVFTPNAA